MTKKPSPDAQQPPAQAPAQPITASLHMADWLTEQNTSLAFTTYQGKLFFVGHNIRGELSLFERTFEHAMGLVTAGHQAQTLYLASAFQIWRLDNVLAEGGTINEYDRLYVPQVGYTTGSLDVHDLAIEADGRVVFANTRFSCIAALSDGWHFNPIWKPSFICDLVAEDRCHLNGVAVEAGQARYATACAATDKREGWRDHRQDGGIVCDIQADQIIARGFSMPHSPRVHQDRLWLLDSGRGYLGYLDPSTGKFERVTFCPGYARGLCFVGNYAVVGLSLPRHEPTFTGLELDNQLSKQNSKPSCGLIVIDLSTGQIAHWLHLSEPIRELYDAIALPGAQRPMAYGFKTEEIRTRVWADPTGLASIQQPK